MGGWCLRFGRNDLHRNNFETIPIIKKPIANNNYHKILCN